MRSYYVIFNARSGTALAAGISPQELQQRFEVAGLSAIVDADCDVPLPRRLADAIRTRPNVIVAAGGDGTVTAVAEAILDTGIALAILPLGTVNALARDLGVPMDIDTWIAEIEHMEPRSIDVGQVNQQIFLHKGVAGVVPGIAAGREQIRGQGLRAKLGFLQFFMRRLVRARRLAVEVRDADGHVGIHRVAAIAVANNAYDEGLGRFLSRDRLDRGQLTLYLLRHLNLGDAVRLAAKMLLGHWRDDEALEITPSDGVIIRTRRKIVKVMLDGEVQSLLSPLTFRIRPAALPILAPPAVAASPLTVPVEKTEPAASPLLEVAGA